MTAEIKDYIAKCEVCATYQKEQPKEPLICRKIPSCPWEIVGSDIFHFQDKDYLCKVDYYSNYFEVDSLKDKPATEVIQVLKTPFARHGIPNRLVSDNGPLFNSFQFQHFAESYDMEHVTSSPHYPQNTGKVENSVKTAKNLLKKSKAARSDIYLALLEWRNTLSEGLASSPAQRMFGRRTRTLISTPNELIKPKIAEDVPGKLLKRKQLQAKYYNMSVKELPALSSGDVVRVKPTDRSGRWYKARVEQQVDVRSYDVRTENGQIFRRNRGHLRSSKEPMCASTNPVADSLPEVAPTNLVPAANPISGESSTSQEVQLPTDATESVAQDKVNSGARPKGIPVPSKPVKSTDLPVTRSGRVSKPPSYLKDFLALK